jgi:threonine/homoserine/homoserine lactone efflux protein
MTTALCAALGLVIYLAYAVLFSQAAIRSAYSKVRRVIDGMVAAFFGYSGLKLILTRPDAS